MERKEKIYAFISSENYIPLKTDEIAVLLDVPKSDYDEFLSILNELVNRVFYHATPHVVLVLYVVRAMIMIYSYLLTV